LLTTAAAGLEGHAPVSIPLLHTPSAAGVDELEAVTVGRIDLLDILTRRITASARDGSRPHTLVVAGAGAGKTHTMRVALHRACADAATAKSVLPVVISEDAL